MKDAILNILDESLEAMLSRGERAGDCCRRHPEAAMELKSLLGLAMQSRQSLAATMPEPAKAALRERLVAQAEVRAAGRKSFAFAWLKTRRLVLRPLVIAAAISLLGAGTAFAAVKAPPDSILFPLKTRLESARTLMAWQKLDRAAVETGYANKRLDEIAQMVEQNKPEFVPDLLANYHMHIDTAAGLADEARAEGEDTGEVEAMIAAARSRQQQLLGEINDRLPEDVRETIRGDLDEAGGDDDDTDSGYPPAPTAPAPGGVYHDDDSFDDSDDDYQPPGGGGYDDADNPSGGSGSGAPEPEDGPDDSNDGEVEAPTASSYEEADDDEI